MSSGIHKNIKKDRGAKQQNSIGFFAKSQPTRALFERSELCRSVGGSAFCKKSVNGIRFSYLYLFYVFMNTRYISVIQIRIYSKLSANSSIVLIFSSFIVDLIVTTGSTISIFLNPSTIPFMIFAAIGAHDPFSINATLRF